MEIKEIKVGVYIEYDGLSPEKILTVGDDGRCFTTARNKSYGTVGGIDYYNLVKPWEPQENDQIISKEYGKTMIRTHDQGRPSYWVHAQPINSTPVKIDDLEPYIENPVVEQEVATGICHKDENGNIKMPDLDFQPKSVMLIPISDPEFQVGDEVICSSHYNDAVAVPFKAVIESEYKNVEKGIRWRIAAMEEHRLNDFTFPAGELWSMRNEDMKHIQKETPNCDTLYGACRCDKCKSATLKTINFDLQQGESESKRVAMMLGKEKHIEYEQNILDIHRKYENEPEDLDCEEHEDSLSKHGEFMRNLIEESRKDFGGRNKILGHQ